MIFFGVPNLSLSINGQGQGQHEPSVVQAIPPSYPPIALAAHVSGEVVIDATVDSQGAVESTRSVSGHKLLCPMAERIAKKWIFSPLDQGSEKRIARLHFIFTLVPTPRTFDEMMTIFRPPYSVEIRDTPSRIIATPNIDPPSKTTRKKRK
jgi:TonB family protein